MPIKTIIPGVTFTSPTGLPKVQVDSILPEAGALFLAEPAHPSRAWAAGVPANAATVPNLAWSQAAATIGSGTEASLSVDIYNVGLSGTKGLVERSGKGGVHAIISPTVATTQVDSFNVAYPAAIYDYVRSHPNNQLFMSMWVRLTRVASVPSAGSFLLGGIVTDGSFAIAMGYNANYGGRTISGHTPSNALGNQHKWVSAMPPTTFPTDSNTTGLANPPLTRSAFVGGNRISSGFTAGKPGQGGSRIFYRAYLEDLTVSGRTAAAVAALDVALFDAAFGAGGRYAADTFTDPATIA